MQLFKQLNKVCTFSSKIHFMTERFVENRVDLINVQLLYFPERETDECMRDGNRKIKTRDCVQTLASKQIELKNRAGALLQCC